MFYPYKTGSNSAKVLSQALGVKQIKREGSKFKGSPKKVVVNWGCSTLPEEVEKCMIVNEAKYVKIASNKLSFFNYVKDKISIPEFTTDKDEARKWVEEGKVVLGRTTLTGHSGQGIYIMEDLNTFDKTYHGSFKLYVKYIPKKDEYRVHVVEGEVIDVRRKALRQDVHKESANWKVRTHATGFNFVKEGFETPQAVLEESIKAVEAVGLHFGAVDVVWNAFYEKAFILEINSAPGLEGSSVVTYQKAFEKFYKEPVKKKKPEIDFGVIAHLIDNNPVKAVKVAQPMYILEEGEEINLDADLLQGGGDHAAW